MSKGEFSSADIEITNMEESSLFDDHQILQIRLGLEQGLDVLKYYDHTIPWKQMKDIRQDLENNSEYNIKDYSQRMIEVILLRVKRNMDISEYLDPKLDYESERILDQKEIDNVVKLLAEDEDIFTLNLDQIFVVQKFLKKRIDFSKYTVEQLKQIKLGFRNNVDVTVYANAELSHVEMERIRLQLQEKLS